MLSYWNNGKKDGKLSYYFGGGISGDYRGSLGQWKKEWQLVSGV